MGLLPWFLIVSCGLQAGTADFEQPATFQASKILPGSVVRGPHHTVAERVTAEHYYQQFQITSTYGDMEAEGRSVLKTRLVEIDALVRLDDVSRTEVFVKAAGGALLNTGRGVVSALRDPEATVKGIGSGIKRFGVNLGRKGKRAFQSATADEPKHETEDESVASKAGEAAGSAALSVLGVNGAARRWAQKLNVDPYTTNPVLHEALVSIGKIDAAGRIATRIVVPIPMLLSTTATVGGLVWGADPEQVRKVNEQRLRELGVSEQEAAPFLKSQAFTLTNQTRFVAALSSVNAPGCADYVSTAAESEDEREALFFVESAELLAGLHETRPVSAILMDSRAMVADAGSGRVVALLPFDYVRWTEALARSALEIAARARQELHARSLEANLTGTVSEAARTGLAAAGWKVKEGVTEGLLFKPAD